MPRYLLFLVAMVLLLGLAACASDPTASPGALSSETAPPTVAATSTEAPNATATPEAPSSNTPALTSKATSTATLTETPPPTPTKTPEPEPTETPTAEPTPSATPTFAPPAIPFPDDPSELGDMLTRPIDGMVMVYVPGGTFLMGSLPDDDQFGPHTVTLDGFWIDQTEVTNAQVAAFLNDQGLQKEGGYNWVEVEQVENAQIEMIDGRFQPEPGKADHPVVEISWNGAAAYCEWVGGRLPTEAEWEYAARGPEAYIYPWGADLPTCDRAHFGGCGDYSVPVGSFGEAGASWCGAQDMAGNVWEWTADYYAKYPAEAQTNPTGPETGEFKMVRGGSFLSSADTLHAAYRFSSARTLCNPNIGYRCAASGRTPATSP